MEMPMDILNARLGKIRDNGDIDFDNTAAAIDIDSELQEKFLFIPIEELEAADIREVEPGTFHAGDGPEKCSAQNHENPTWLYNHGMNALALWWKLKQDAEKEQEKLAKRPEPGIYQGSYKGGSSYFTVIVTQDRRVLVAQTDGGFDEYTEGWDEENHKIWNLQRVDITDGTISA